MKLTITQQNLERVVAAVRGAADSKATLPVLTCIRLDAEAETLTAAATDLQVSVIARADCRAEETGSVCVAAGKLTEIAKALPAGDVTLETIEGGRLRLSAGKARFDIAALPGKDFPKMPDATTGAEVDAAVLAEVIARTLYAASCDTTREHLAGVYLESDGETLLATSTDGHRLAHVERKLVGVPTLKTGVIAPRKGLQEIAKLIDGAEKCGLAIGGGHISATCGGSTVVARLVDGNFPPYAQVIPKTTRERIAVVNRGELLDACRRALLVVTRERAGAEFSFDKSAVTVRASDPDSGEAREVVDAEGGEAQAVGLNVRYVSDALAAMDCDEVSVGYAGELDPVVIEPRDGTGTEDDCAVVMPMRL